MKVSINWSKELVDLKISIEELIHLLPLRTIGIKDITNNFIELDMKGYNRADLLSLRGVAYEVGAITDSNISFSELDINFDSQNDLNVQVQNSDIAPLYCLVKIEGLRVNKSSDEWIKKLADSGVRSINNIADITNLIMLEYGQPMHAFDASDVSSETVIVRTARDGEEIETLDGKKRKLQSSDLLITDHQKALGIAGLMGGKASEIKDSTTTILLEAAIFDPINIRSTASKLNLFSEAQKRFQHGLTKRRLFQALDAAIKMYQDLGGKLTGISIVGNLQDEEKVLTLTQEKLNSLVGLEIPPARVEEILEKLHFEVLASQGDALQSWEVKVPYWRLDINIEEDLIEEVARLFGYENIPVQELNNNIPDKIDQSKFELIKKLKEELVKLGFNEVQTYSFYSSQVLNYLEIAKSRLVKIANPISSETEYLRDKLWPNLLEVVAKNLKLSDKVGVFEIGKVYKVTSAGEVEERYKLSLALSDGTSNPASSLYQFFKILEQQIELNIQVGEDVDNKCSLPILHPTRVKCLDKDNKPVGVLAEVRPKIVNKFGLDKRVAVLEVEVF